MFKPLILIPVFDHATQFESFAPKLTATGTPVLVVDDGSSPTEASALKEICQKHGFELLRREKNQGKGAAFKHGFFHARERGFSHVLQIDADGQHNATDIPRFFEIAQREPHALIAGTPLYDESVPAARKFGRKITNFWCVLETRSLKIGDAMCGFRVYPIEGITPALTATRAERMGFDIEIAVRAVWLGMRIINTPTRVIYPPNGRSHFHAFRDNVRISLTHARLFLRSFFPKKS